MPIRFITNEKQRSRHALVVKLRGFGYEIDDEEIFSPPIAAAKLLSKDGYRPLCLLAAGEKEATHVHEHNYTHLSCNNKLIRCIFRALKIIGLLLNTNFYARSIIRNMNFPQKSYPINYKLIFPVKDIHLVQFLISNQCLSMFMCE